PPAETVEQQGPGARVAGAEHPHADELAVRRERANHAGARGAVTGDVALAVRLDDRLVSVQPDRDRLLHRPDGWVIELDAAVQDAHAYACTRRASPGPVPRDALGPVGRKSDPMDGVAGQAPGGQRFGHQLAAA